MTPTWNPRYLAYCRAHGEHDPEAMLAVDEWVWPGGRMCGFQLWISERWGAWCRAHGRRMDDPKFPADHDDFDLRLALGLLGDGEP